MCAQAHTNTNIQVKEREDGHGMGPSSLTTAFAKRGVGGKERDK